MQLFFFFTVVFWSCRTNVFSLPSGAVAQPTLPRGTLRVLTYNIQGIPSIFTRSNRRRNIAQISPILNTFDISLIQENFAYNKDLQQAIRVPYQLAAPKKHGFGVFSGSGLHAFSRYPLDELTHQAWKKCHGYWRSANDCMANKGLQAMRIYISGQADSHRIDMYNVHMDAGRSMGDQQARAMQVRQLLTIIEQYSKNKPLIVAGDFNMRTANSSRPVDKESMQYLLQQAGLQDACTVLSCKHTNELDRVLFRPTKELYIQPTAWQKATGFVDKGGNSLSDHPPIIVDFRLHAGVPQERKKAQ